MLFEEEYYVFSYRTTERESQHILVLDRSNQQEMTRLEIQDRMLTNSMGGVLPEVADPSLLRRVLDVGCGPGGWLFETARTYPTIEQLISNLAAQCWHMHVPRQSAALQMSEYSFGRWMPCAC